MDCTIEQFAYKHILIQVKKPVALAVQQWYKNEPDSPFPFWAKIWPAAKALSYFIIDNNTILSNKTVVEFGAGLGLPTLTAANYCRQVLSTDYLEQPLQFIQTSAAINGYVNITTSLFNWENESEYPQADIVLLSDVNYNTQHFGYMHHLINHYLSNGAIVLLSTPQRLMAKTFVTAIASFIAETVIYTIDDVTISVYVLKNNVVE